MIFIYLRTFLNFEMDNYDDIENEFENGTIDNIGHELYKQSRFYYHFCKIRDSIQVDEYGDRNLMHSVEFSNYLLKCILPYSPLWSAFIIENQSNAIIENYFGIIKNQILSQTLNQKPSRFFIKIREFIDSRIKELKFAIPEKLRKVNHSKKTREQSTISKMIL